jgi:hypothetical protein
LLDVRCRELLCLFVLRLPTGTPQQIECVATVTVLVGHGRGNQFQGLVSDGATLERVFRSLVQDRDQFFDRVRLEFKCLVGQPTLAPGRELETGRWLVGN